MKISTETIIPKGHSMSRVEDQDLITGRGRYTDNNKLARMVHLHLVRSHHAHARIISIDSSKALEMPGVLAVYTVDDLIRDGVNPYPVPGPPDFSPKDIVEAGYRREDGSPMQAPIWYALAKDEVRYVGEPVVAVLAETVAQAVDAAEMVEVNYETLPAVGTIEQAASPDAPQIWKGAPGNVLIRMELGDQDKTEKALSQSAHVTRLELKNNRLVGNALEPRASVCERDPQTGRFTLYAGHQSPTGLRESLAKNIFNWDLKQLRVVVGHLGGGFGIRAETYPEEILTVYAASKQNRPVKWCASRTEDFVGTVHGRDQINSAELACDAQGRIQALKIDTLGNAGAYPTGGVCIPLVVGTKITTSLYHVPTFYYDARMYLTNTMPMGAYRGAGRPEMIYLIERLIQKTAEEMGIDPIEFRRRNFISPQSMPYTTAIGEVYDSGRFSDVLDSVLESSGWNSYEQRRQGSEQRGMLRGRGISCYIEWTGAVWFEEVTTAAQSDGSVTLYTGTQNMGQGLQTAFTQILSEQLGLPASKIQVVQGDTDLVKGVGSFGSRSLYIGGSAVVEGAEKFVEEGKRLAANALEAAIEDILYEQGCFSVVGTNVGIDLFDLAAQQPDEQFSVYSKTNLVNENGVGYPSWPNGCQVAEVEIDPETGTVRLDRLTSVDDVGNAVNPMLVEGQVHGGIVQSVGQAILEEAHYDEEGQLLTSSFMDYAMPRADDLPSFNCGLFKDAPCLTNPLGSKGVGELGTVGATPAIVNAVMDALRGRNVTGLEMPLKPEKIWKVLQT